MSPIDYGYIDLRQFDAAYNSATIDSATPQEVPTGVYTVLVDSVNLTNSKTKNEPMLSWKLKVLDPSSYQGQIIWKNSVFNQNSIKWIKKELETCGLILNHLSTELPEKINKLVGTKLEIKKTEKNGFSSVYFVGCLEEKKTDVLQPNEYPNTVSMGKVPF